MECQALDRRGTVPALLSTTISDDAESVVRTSVGILGALLLCFFKGCSQGYNDPDSNKYFLFWPHLGPKILGFCQTKTILWS